MNLSLLIFHVCVHLCTSMHMVDVWSSKHSLREMLFPSYHAGPGHWKEVRFGVWCPLPQSHLADPLLSSLHVRAETLSSGKVFAEGLVSSLVWAFLCFLSITCGVRAPQLCFSSYWLRITSVCLFSLPKVSNPFGRHHLVHAFIRSHHRGPLHSSFNLFAFISHAAPRAVCLKQRRDPITLPRTAPSARIHSTHGCQALRVRSAHGVRSGDQTDEAPTPGSFTFPGSLAWTRRTWASTVRPCLSPALHCHHRLSLIPHRLCVARLWQLNLFTGSCISTMLFHTPVIFSHLPFTLLAHIHPPIPIHLKWGDIILNHSKELKQSCGFLTICELHAAMYVHTWTQSFYACSVPEECLMVTNPEHDLILH